MSKLGFVFVGLALLCAVPVFAQGPFTDVPTDHWAYDAVNKLQQDGLLIGYPDGTFQGKRAITRYEFAAAIARIPVPPEAGQTPLPTDLIKRKDLDDALKGYAKKSDIPDVSKLASKADVDAIRKLVDEFRDELAALGVDVDALKRDVACLAARVDALEAEQKRVRLTGEVNAFAIATDGRGLSSQTPVDLDERLIDNTHDTFAKSLGVVRDFDLNIVGRVSDVTTANATVNYGNYLNYVRFVDDYVDGARPTNKSDVQPAVGPAALQKSFVDAFFPYYLYIDTTLGKGSLCVGRFPLQFTPYTLKKIDVDTYTTNTKTDDGNYPVDGAKLGYKFGVVDLSLYAAKHDENDYLLNGLTGQPASAAKAATGLPIGPFNVLGGSSVGGLDELITQSAGVRAEIGTPWKGKIGATFYQAWSRIPTGPAGADWDQAQVFGADLAVPFAKIWSFVGSWTQSNTLASETSTAANIDDSNVAWDAKVNVAFGKLGVGAGYKDIGPNFAAAGAWDKIGRWTNPVNIKGPYAQFTYPILQNLSFNVNGEFLTVKNNVATNTRLAQDDQIIKAEGDLNWGFSKSTSVGVGYEMVRFSPDAAGTAAKETYLTVGLAHQMSPTAALKVGYQFIDYTGGTSATSPIFAYGNSDYKAGLGVVQLGVSF